MQFELEFVFNNTNPINPFAPCTQLSWLSYGPSLGQQYVKNGKGKNFLYNNVS